MDVVEAAIGHDHHVISPFRVLTDVTDDSSVESNVVAVLPRLRTPSTTRSGESVCSGGSFDAPKTCNHTSSAGSNDSMNACSNTRRRHVCDRGSNTAQTRSPGIFDEPP